MTRHPHSLSTRATRILALTLAILGLSGLAAGTAQAASPAWKLLSSTGPTNLPPYVNDQQSVTVNAVFGSYRLTFNGSTTPDLSVTASAATMQAALNALPSISAGDGSVTVTGGPGNLDGRFPYVVSFDGGPLAGTQVPLMTTSAVSTIGGVSAYGQLPGVTVNPTPSSTIHVYATNVGGAATSGPYTVTVSLPPGLTTSRTPYVMASGTDWSCTPTGAGQSTVSCTKSTPVRSGLAADTLNLPVKVAPGVVEGVVEAEVSISGGGASPASYVEPITISSTPAQPGVQAMWAGAFDEDGNPYTQAGGHPFSALAAFSLNTVMSSLGNVMPAGGVRNINVALPAGFVANPLVAPRCPRNDMWCDRNALVGNVGPVLINHDGGFGKGAFTNVLPPVGSPVQLSFPASLARVNTTARVRPDDFGVTSLAPDLPTNYYAFASLVTLWGQPGNPLYDEQRCKEISCPAVNPGTVDDAFLTNPTECSGVDLITSMEMDVWQAPGVFSSASDAAPAITGCGLVPFEPTVDVAATSSGRDSASGLDFDVELPQANLLDINAIATSHLDDVTVELPEGLAVNPSGATGLEGCSDAQMAVGTDSVPQCPDGSKIGVVEITSPLVDHPIGGTMYLGTPKSTDPMSGEMLRLFVVARDDRTGTLIKLPGSSTADPETGKLTATFENNTRLPFDHRVGSGRSRRCCRRGAATRR